MSALQHKLLRTIKTTLGQFIALTVIALGGVAAYYGINTALAQLINSQEAFYQQTRFASYYFDFVQAPASITKKIERVPGVLNATGRIQKDVKTIRDQKIEDTARLTSYGKNTGQMVNQLYLTGGRMFNPNNSGVPEVLIDRQYAAAKNIKFGDQLTILVEGRRIALRVIGTANNPEFMYKLKNALEFPDSEGMVMIMLSERQARQIFKMPAEINQVVVQISPGADEVLVSQKIKDLLKPYGLVSSYPRRDQFSHKYVQSQINGLQMAANITPPGFFLVTIMVQFVLLRRLIKSQHLQIGIMKALGYENHSIITLYTAYSMAVTTAGLILGLVIGAQLAGTIGGLLARILELPFQGGGINWPALINSAIISTLTGLTSGLLASWEITRINPVDAFRTEPPVAQNRSLFEKWQGFWESTSSDWKMSLRSISRNKGRFGATTMGITVAVALMVLAIYFTDSRDFLVKQYFNVENNYDYTIRFSEPVPLASVSSWNSWPEIKVMEPALEVPITLYKPGAEGVYRTSKDDILIGLPMVSGLRKFFDADRMPLSIPESGIVLGHAAAKKLALTVGDTVIAESKPGMGRVSKTMLVVRSVNKQNIGGNSFVSLAQGSAMIGEGRVINAVLIESAPSQFKSLEERLANIPEITSILSQEKQKKNALALMAAMTYFTVILIAFALIIGCAIVYNNSIMSFSERQRELASLKIIGWSNEDVARLLFYEILLAMILGIALGLPMGKVVGGMYLNAISTETFIWPIVLYPSTYVISALATVGFALIGHFLGIRRVKNLDLIEVLKDRE